MSTIPRLVRLTTNYSTRGKHFFNGFYADPNTSDLELKGQRFHQRRPISQNPFVKPVREREPVSTQNSPVASRQTSYNTTDNKEATRAGYGDQPELEYDEAEAPRLENPGPTWIYLFYDLAWTATFASLTQNGQFNAPWDSVSYGAFFMVVWWMWTSQVGARPMFAPLWFLTIISFLCDLSIEQVPPYFNIPPIDNLRDDGGYDQSIDEIADPGRYANERLAKVSIDVIAFSIALILGYAHWTIKKSGGTVPGKLYVIPIGLCISTPLFFAAWGVSRASYGCTPHGAKIKFYLWGFGLVVEGASHLRITRLRWLRRWIKLRARRRMKSHSPSSSKPRLPVGSRDVQSGTLVMPQSDVQTRSRLEAITTIILGEGVNGIAGTLYSVVSAPSLGGPIVSNVTCAAFIICFLAYLYFEGPTGGRELKPRGRRRVCWVVLHFPFLLSVILLLQGVKNQFLLTSYLSSANASYKDLNA
ncbi:hypothetical protein FRC07_006496, partial [Ceratobasidium sp. 392]